jgi:DUF177 domain-containing protein
MQINVAQLLKWPVGTTRIHPIDAGQTLWLDDESAVRITGGRVRLDRIDTGILARGDVEGSIELECSRCLEHFTAPVRVHFEEGFAPSIEVHTGTALPPPEDDLTFTIDANHILDLSEALRQNIIAALPIQPVCREGCAGLCPLCGGNRNEHPCTCVDDQEGNRPFAALRGLLH